jgi:hypothetical protein
MLIVLITLGAFAITSASVNRKFSQKALEWSQTYFALDILGERFLRDADAALALAENQAVEYLVGQGFTKVAYEGVSDGLQRSLYAAYSSGFTDQDLSAILIQVHREFLEAAFGTLARQYEGLVVTETEGGLRLQHTLAWETDPDLRINITLAAVPADYFTIQAAGEMIILQKAPEAKRYEILNWSQQQRQEFGAEVEFEENLMFFGE